MGLPESLRVKISSEVAEGIGISPVVVQEMTLEELVRMMLGLTGKDANRIRELLLRGTIVSGASRFRWQGFEADNADVEEYLTRYPDAEPDRAFRPADCYQASLRYGPKKLLLEREAGEKRRLFRSRSFWEELLALIESPAYVEYSYKERADVYRARLGAQAQERLRAAAGLLAYATFERQVREGRVTQVDLYVRR